MELIKRHKGLAIVGTLALILLIIMFAIFARMIFSSGDSEYGDRLKNIVKVEKSVLTENKEKIEEYEEVEEASIRVQGKIIYTTIIFTENTKKDRAKEIAKSTIEYYDEEIIKDYDFEYFLTQNIEVAEDEEDQSYTIIGTKHPDIDYISWTKN